MKVSISFDPLIFSRSEKQTKSKSTAAKPLVSSGLNNLKTPKDFSATNIISGFDSNKSKSIKRGSKKAWIILDMIFT